MADYKEIPTMTKKLLSFTSCVGVLRRRVSPLLLCSVGCESKIEGLNVSVIVPP